MSHDHCHSHDHGHCHHHDHDECCSHHHHECCGEDHEHHASYSEAFLELADEAWMEVLKEKIKDHIRAKDARINELATIIAEANHERWKQKMVGKHGCDSFKEKLHHYFEGTGK